jgi:hypothetical protein
MLVCIAGVGLILIDKEREDRWQQKKWTMITL